MAPKHFLSSGRRVVAFAIAGFAGVVYNITGLSLQRTVAPDRLLVLAKPAQGLDPTPTLAPGGVAPAPADA